MKKILIILALTAFVSFSTIDLIAQNAPPPPADHGQQGGSAPIGGGLEVLLALAAAYGVKKVYNHRHKAEKAD